MEWRFERDMLMLLIVACISGMIVFALESPSYTNLSYNNSIPVSNFSTMASNFIKIGNCIFPLKLYNNMTAPQIENATLICYK